MTPEMTILAPAASFFAVVLLVSSLLSPRKNATAEKLQAYSYRAAQDPDSLNRPFSDRIVAPFLERIGRLAGSTTPQRVQERLKEALDEAGNPLTINAYFALRGLGAVGLPLVYLALIGFVHGNVGLTQVAIAAAAAYLGNYLPRYWVSSKAKARRKAIERALPDALDLIVVSMEAGLALDGALVKVVEKTRGPLAEEFQKALREIQLGKPRREALRQLGQRSKVRDLIALVNAVAQADQMGVSMAQVMRTQADEARLKRRQRAEERAHQAAVKMLFPLVLFILPSVMMVTVGPAALQIYKQFSSGLVG